MCNDNNRNRDDDHIYSYKKYEWSGVGRIFFKVHNHSSFCNIITITTFFTHSSSACERSSGLAMIWSSRQCQVSRGEGCEYSVNWMWMHYNRYDVYMLLLLFLFFEKKRERSARQKLEKKQSNKLYDWWWRWRWAKGKIVWFSQHIRCTIAHIVRMYVCIRVVFCWFSLLGWMPLTDGWDGRLKKYVYKVDRRTNVTKVSHECYGLCSCGGIEWMTDKMHTGVQYIFSCLLLVIPFDNIKHSLLSMYLFGFGVGKGEKNVSIKFFFSFSVYFSGLRRILFCLDGYTLCFWVKWYMKVDKCHDPPPAFVRILWYPYLYFG